ncbi:TRAP transporter small permease [Halomonas elongata]|uniref:TRAP transporter small permease n=1 Tax=Halomonas elongata TaxID=2746 RepID=UPI00186B9C0B|nr:TRAP transporter small permease [Halomonas elongata]MBW5800436.1 TRAP transporter small permease [Halomonas elongata]
MPSVQHSRSLIVRSREAANRVLAILLLVIFALLVAVVTVQVLSRYLTDSPTIITDEIARFLLIWLGLLGAAYASGAMRHLAIDFLPERLPDIARRWLKVALQAIILLFAGYVMMFGGGELVRQTLANGQTTPMLGIAMGWVYIALPLSGAFIAFFSLLEIVALARAPHPSGDDV